MSESAYRSDDPAIVKAWDDHRQAGKDAVAEMERLGAEVAPNHKVIVLDAWVTYLAGWDATANPEPPAETGWRQAQAMTRHGEVALWVPDERFTAGKELAQRIAALPRVRPVIAMSGMPDEVSIPSDHPGATERIQRPLVFSHNGAIYVRWRTDPADAQTHLSHVDDVDLKVWERITLSQLHLAAEEAGVSL